MNYIFAYGLIALMVGLLYRLVRWIIKQIKNVLNPRGF
jgi:hypothetical protein